MDILSICTIHTYTHTHSLTHTHTHTHVYVSYRAWVVDVLLRRVAKMYYRASKSTL